MNTNVSQHLLDNYNKISTWQVFPMYSVSDQQASCW